MIDFNKLFNNIPEAVVVLAPDFPNYTILACTDKYLEVTMRSRDNIVGLHFLKQAFPDKEVAYEQNPVKLSLDKVLETKKIDYLDVLRYDLVKPETQGGGYDTRFWEASHTPVLNENGEVEYIIQETNDVTERELAKMALSESEHKFQFMAEAMPQLIFTTDTDGNITYLNKRWEEYTGMPIKELMADGWEKVIHPDDLKQTTEKWQKAFEKGEEMQVELRKRDKNGNYRWHLCRTLPMKDADGKILMWIGSSTDIHDMRQMVQELLETNEQMAQLSDQVQIAYLKAETERKTLKNLIMKAPAFCCVLKGPEHRYDLVNDQYQMLFPNRELLNKTVAEAIPEVIDQGFIDILDNVYHNAEEFIANEIFVQLDRTGTGELEDNYLTFIYQPIFNEQDRVYGIMVFGYDVTEQVVFRNKINELGYDKK
ncbi:MAG: PAS domain-containing protein [Hymenobacteraceae bacterium]|nr:PAS domain-containing protein [Hymenobacteraceae bacterium]MDX5396039.1 PAS domain-containing protein [Hymenobacteraceae bacterium]MDX5512100.1 PAS domain-containing protein [Hymenobacteraceae bacterium]